MFTSSTFILAAISVLARVAVATPPACLLGAVGAQANPADMKALCGTGAFAVEGNITSLCTGDASSQAMSIFSSTCLAAGVTISVSSSTSSGDSSSSSSSATTTGSDSVSATGTSGSTTGHKTATSTHTSASGTATSHSNSKGTNSSSTSTSASSTATGAASAGFSTSREHALYLTPIFLGALAYFL